MWSYAFAKNLRNVGGRFDVTFRPNEFTSGVFARPRLQMHTFSDVKTYHPGSVKCTHEAGQGVFRTSICHVGSCA